MFPFHDFAYLAWQIMKLEIEHYSFSPLFFLLILAAIVGMWLSVFLFRKREKSGVIFLSIWTFAAGVWSLTYAFEYAATEVTLKILWSKLSYFGIVFCPVSFFFFTLAYSSRLKLLKKKLVWLVYALATFFILSPLTNDWHKLHWRSVSIYPETNTTDYVYGIFFWLFFVFTYFFLFSGIVNLYLLYFRFPKRYKSQIGLFIAATIFPIAGNVLYVFNFNPIPGFDWTPLSFMISGVILTVNFFMYGVFDLVPFARGKLFDMMPDAVLVTDAEGRIADINPAMEKLMQRKEKDVIGKSWIEFYPEWEYLIKEKGLQRTNKSQISFDFNGERVHYDFQSSPLYDEKGDYSGNLTNLRDVTVRRNAENQLQQAYEQQKVEMAEKERLIVDLDAFAHTVAHDLKNMLGAIITSADLLKSSFELGDEEETKEIVELISLSSKKTLHITQELLLLASVRQQEIKTEMLEMCDIVDEAIRRNQNLINETNAELVLPENCLPAIGYGPWVESVWENYISNALKYGGRPAKIEFGSEEIEGNMIKFWIKDNGNGIPPKQQKLLFSKFTRFENLRIEGHGLGLSIVKRIIDKLGGTVGVESSAKPGEGSLFYFTLPTK